MSRSGAVLLAIAIASWDCSPKLDAPVVKVDYTVRPAVITEGSLIAGLPIELQTTVSNGRAAATVDFGPNYVDGFQFDLLQPDGSRLSTSPRAHRNAEYAYVPGVVELAPGESQTLSALLNPWLPLDLTGEYRLQIIVARGKGLPLPQGAVIFQLLPRTEANAARACEQLYAAAAAAKTGPGTTRATEALSYVRDSCAVAYLDRIVFSANLNRLSAINGLARIGTPAARAVLLAATTSYDLATADDARAALRGLDRVSKH